MPALGMRQTERSLITLVPEGLRHNYSKVVSGPERKIAPWQVRAVEEFIVENASQSANRSPSVTSRLSRR
jgi:hypothetical protein